MDGSTQHSDKPMRTVEELEADKAISDFSATYSEGLPGAGPVNFFSHVKHGTTPYGDRGLRDFFVYRDLGVAKATGGRILCHLVKANQAPEYGTGWHRHQLGFHIVYMVSGWAKFMYSNVSVHVGTGDCVYMPPGISHYLYDYSQDMEFLEIESPVESVTEDVEPCCEIPQPTPWPEQK